MRPFVKESVILFMQEHEGHTVRIVGEYGGTQEQWLQTSPENGWDKVEM
jgi:hypothetical protein